MPRNNPSEPWIPSSVEENDAPLPHDDISRAVRDSLYETGVADKGTDPLATHWFQSGKNPNDESRFWIGTDKRVYGKGQKLPDGVSIDGIVQVIVMKLGDEWYARAFVRKEGEVGLEDFAIANSGMGDTLPLDPEDPKSAPQPFKWQKRELFAAKDPKTAVRQALVDLQANGVFFDPTASLYRRPRMARLLPGLGIAAVIAAFGLFAWMSGGKAPATPEPARPKAVSNADGSISLGDRKYYVVYGVDPAKDTGNEVCASVGKSCVGYTDLTTSVCQNVHPGAQVSSDLDGSSAGFYCNGAPQGGVCGRETNTCHICPACNLNMDCGMEVGVLYAETYVECR